MHLPPQRLGFRPVMGQPATRAAGRRAPEIGSTSPTWIPGLGSTNRIVLLLVLVLEISDRIEDDAENEDDESLHGKAAYAVPGALGPGMVAAAMTRRLIRMHRQLPPLHSGGYPVHGELTRCDSN